MPTTALTPDLSHGDSPPEIEAYRLIPSFSEWTRYRSLNVDVPTFALDDASGLEDLLEASFLRNGVRPRVSLETDGQGVPIWKPFAAAVLEKTV